MLKYLNNKARSTTSDSKGMTLVEVMVAMVIALIVIGLTSGMLISGTRFFNHSAMRAEDERIASTILAFTLSELRFATEIKVDSMSANPPKPVVGRGLIYMMAPDGKRAVTGMIGFKRPFDPEGAVNVYGESFYSGRTVGIRMQTISKDVPKVIKIFVDVFDEDEKVVYSDSGTIEIPNVPQNSPPTSETTVEPTATVLIDYLALPDRVITSPTP